MKLGQLIEYNKRKVFLQKYAENEVGKTSSRLLSNLKKNP